MEMLQPKGWKRPNGYSHGIAAEGKMIFVAGQVGWDENCQFQSSRLSDQVKCALENIVTVLREGNAQPSQIVRMTWYVADVREYHSQMKSVGEVYRQVIGDHYPAMTLIEVARLFDDGAKVEIEATAVVPGESRA